MNSSIIRIILWLHTLIAGAAGLAFYLFPAVAAFTWPWQLPGLAARFVGALLLSGAVYSAFSATAKNDLPIPGMLLTASGYSLIAMVGLLHNELGLTTHVVIWLVVWGGAALVFCVLLFMAARAQAGTTRARPMANAVRTFFTLHMALVAPVGLAMYLAPVWARSYWPWTLAPINVRLIGAMFVVTAVLSLWCIRQRAWDAVAPTLITYGTFATMALLASLIHFELFDPARLVTWAFIAVYVIVAGGAWYLLWRQSRLQHAVA
jgi:hypothetical protein